MTSLEYLPEDEASVALAHMAPTMLLVDGDGSELLPKMIASMTAAEAAATMVIFDGEKRVPAHKTYEKIRDRIPLAAFDDSGVPEFRKFLDTRGEVWWETGFEALFEPIDQMTRAHVNPAVRDKLVAGDSHTTFVRGGTWALGTEAVQTDSAVRAAAG